LITPVGTKSVAKQDWKKLSDNYSIESKMIEKLIKVNFAVFSVKSDGKCSTVYKLAPVNFDRTA
jgi:hypothetical protein